MAENDFAELQMALSGQAKQEEAEESRDEEDSSDEESSSEEDLDLPIDPEKCTAGGPGFAGGSAGAPVSFYVTAKNTNGKRVKEGGAYVVIKVTPGNSAKAAGAEPKTTPVKDNNNGTYSATYSVPVRGDYELSIEINGSPIGGSPFPVFFSPPDPSATAAASAAAANELAATTGLPGLPGGLSLQQLGLGGVGLPDISMANIAAGATAALTTNMNLAAQAVSAGVIFPEKAEELERTLFIANLNPLVTIEQLKQLFGFCGIVLSCRKAGTGEQFAFVEYGKNEEATAALAMNNMQLMDRPMKVELAKLIKEAAPAGAANPFMALQMQQMQQLQLAQLQQKTLAAQVAAMRAQAKVNPTAVQTPGVSQNSASQKAAALAAAAALNKRLGIVAPPPPVDLNPPPKQRSRSPRGRVKAPSPRPGKRRRTVSPTIRYRTDRRRSRSPSRDRAGKSRERRDREKERHASRDRRERKGDRDKHREGHEGKPHREREVEKDSRAEHRRERDRASRDDRAARDDRGRNDRDKESRHARDRRGRDREHGDKDDDRHRERDQRRRNADRGPRDSQKQGREGAEGRRGREGKVDDAGKPGGLEPVDEQMRALSSAEEAAADGGAGDGPNAAAREDVPDAAVAVADQDMLDASTAPQEGKPEAGVITGRSGRDRGEGGRLDRRRSDRDRSERGPRDEPRRSSEGRRNDDASRRDRRDADGDRAGGDRRDKKRQDSWEERTDNQDGRRTDRNSHRDRGEEDPQTGHEECGRPEGAAAREGAGGPGDQVPTGGAERRAVHAAMTDANGAVDEENTGKVETEAVEQHSDQEMVGAKRKRHESAEAAAMLNEAAATLNGTLDDQDAEAIEGSVLPERRAHKAKKSHKKHKKHKRERNSIDREAAELQEPAGDVSSDQPVAAPMQTGEAIREEDGGEV